jgi:FecR protein/Putative zinc-finger
MTPKELDTLLRSIRDDVPADEATRAAALRVRARLGDENAESIQVDHLNSCADFRALFAAYRHRTLPEARQMLVEDHLHTCVACRKIFHGDRAAVIAVKLRNPAWQIMPWALAAAAVAVFAYFAPPIADRILAPSGPRATVASIDGQLFRVSNTGATLLTAGASVNENEELRTAKNSRAILRLRDGSSVEMAERSDLTLAERWRGKTVHLTHGAVMVEAAKQRRGRLEIATPDALVSVKGTIFEVSSGTKGSRVSVVEGEVKVDHAGSSALLHRGDQKTTSETMQPTSVAQDVAWSSNATKYLALLGELSAIQKRIEQIPGPGLRYHSNLAKLVPENTMIFASIPNLGPTLTDATAIFEDRVRQSDVLREWWNEKETQQLKSMVDQVRTFSDYLGDEIVLAVPRGENAAPLLIAEERKPGVDALWRQIPAGESKPPMLVHNHIVAISPRADLVERVSALTDSNADGAFLKTPFWQRISESYAAGAGWLFAADIQHMGMEQIFPDHVPSSNAMNVTGTDNVKYLVIERKDNLGRAENSASLSFSGARHGIASWLAAPGPMATLDFVSPQATFATSFVIRNPAAILSEWITAQNPALAEVEQRTGVNLIADVAQNVGGEISFALDGPVLPTPAWRVAIEVNDPPRIEWAIEQAVKSVDGVQLAPSESNGLHYYALTSTKIAYEIDYAFTDGYLIIAPSPAQLQSAIATRSSGLTLTHSAAFRAQLPQDGHENFSALVYYNMSTTVGPIIDQLKSGGLLTPDQQKSIALLDQNRAPGLIYAYGEPDRIVAASRGSFFGLGLDTLLGLNSKGASALPQLLPPILSNIKSAAK